MRWRQPGRGLGWIRSQGQKLQGLYNLTRLECYWWCNFISSLYYTSNCFNQWIVFGPWEECWWGYLRIHYYICWPCSTNLLGQWSTISVWLLCISDDDSRIYEWWICFITTIINDGIKVLSDHSCFYSEIVFKFYNYNYNYYLKLISIINTL